MFDLIVADELKAPSHNLVGSIADRGDRGLHWENGVTFTNHGCFVIEGFCLICDDAPTNTFTDQECTAPAVFKPFELDLGTSWSPADNFDPEGLVTSDFDAGTSSKLERMIWDGCVGGDSPKLATGTSLGAALTPKQAVGNLVGAFIDSADHIGARGTIYMAPRIAFEMVDLLKEVDGKLVTTYGEHNVIIGNFPSTHIAGHIGNPMLFLGDVRVTDAPDEIRRINMRPVRVQRDALVAWNTCAQFLQSVTLP